MNIPGSFPCLSPNHLDHCCQLSPQLINSFSNDFSQFNEVDGQEELPSYDQAVVNALRLGWQPPCSVEEGVSIYIFGISQ